MDKKLMRAEVEAFRARTAFGQSGADCFPAWYLRHRYGLSESQAVMQSATPAGEESAGELEPAVDAFHLDLSDPRHRVLSIIRARFSDSPNQVAKGFRDLQRGLPRLRSLLAGEYHQPVRENRVMVNLAAALGAIERSVRENLELEFVVLHLNDQNEMLRGGATRVAREDLRDAIRQTLPDWNYRLVDMGPSRIGRDAGGTAGADASWAGLEMSSVTLAPAQSKTEAVMHHGIGRLSDLVDLYNSRRDDLFSRNVRYYLKSRRNVERGPASRIRETLKQACAAGAGGISPELFAFYHNGVTLFAKSVEPIDGGLRVLEPYVLNGCQTIKTAYFFRFDPRLQGRVDEARWRRISIPIRVVTTQDETLVRDITINNNRQNSISYAALRANDPVQIELEERFRKRKIFYQRQEGAYANIGESNPELLDADYEYSWRDYVDIVDLARSIAAAAGEVELAQSPGKIFETEAAYKRVFSEKRLASLVFLTFLQNLNEVIFVVLKKDLDLVPNPGGPKPSRLGYHAMSLLVRYLAKQERHDDVLEFGSQLWGRGKTFREWVSKMLDNHHSGIKGRLKDTFMRLDNSRADSLKDAFRSVERDLRLGDVDAFLVFSRLDQENVAVEVGGDAGI